jgi:dipeptidyl aminopeptidase/acylaminoacyl peptidase
MSRRVRGASFLLGVLVPAAVVTFKSEIADGTSAAPPGLVQTAASAPRNGRIAIISPAGISTIGPDGSLHTVKRCGSPMGPSGCYDLESIDWGPDGRRLAFSVTTIGAISSYNGMHFLNTRTRKERQLPQDGFDIDWSPDGSRIAYVEYRSFPAPVGSIYLLRPDGSGRTLIRTGSAGRDSSPSWSPDGKRLTYDETLGGKHSVWVIDLDGKHRRRLATNGADPAWSPDGRTIAYRTSCGIKLVTKAGEDVTPPKGPFPCRAIGVAGKPVWSPDGGKIAIGNRSGVYVMNADGSQLARRTSDNPTGIFGIARPTWQPIPR